MDIGILEYHPYHQEYVRTLSKICEDHNVTVFKNRKEAINTDLDLLFVDTIQPFPNDYLKWIRFKPKCPAILTIHEANSELDNNIPLKKTVLKKFDAINVTMTQIKNYIIENSLYEGKIFTLPFMLHEKKYPDKSGLFVIPGRIEKFRREYHKILDKDKIEEYLPLCLLGEPIGSYGESIVNLCRHLSDTYRFVIHTYDGFIPADEYDRVLKECRAIVAPLCNPTDGFMGFRKETYGMTKACGSMFEAIKYGKPYISDLKIELDYDFFSLQNMKKYLEEEIIGGVL